MTSGDWLVLAIVTACALIVSRVLDIILTDKEQSENKGERRQ